MHIRIVSDSRVSIHQLKVTEKFCFVYLIYFIYIIERENPNSNLSD